MCGFDAIMIAGAHNWKMVRGRDKIIMRGPECFFFFHFLCIAVAPTALQATAAAATAAAIPSDADQGRLSWVEDGGAARKDSETIRSCLNKGSRTESPT